LTFIANISLEYYNQVKLDISIYPRNWGNMPVKNLKKLFVFTLIALLGVIVIGCGGGGDTTTEPTTAVPEETSIVGEYLIDITDLGMPLIFYLKIDAEDNFYLSPDRTYATDKGHGTIGSSGNTYMLIYSDSTTENPKTSTFEVEDGNLHFQTALPYGSSNLPASKEDEENPEIIYYLLGKTLVYEDYYGEYAGIHATGAMGTQVLYEYYLQLTYGREFLFVSEYTIGDTEYTYEESGFYDLDGNDLTLHLEEDVVGSFDQDMNLTIGVKPSEMGEREERTLQVATTALCANTYYGYTTKEMGGTLMYDTEMVLVLDKFGGYTYTATDTVNGVVSESGSFTFDNGDLEFFPADSTESYTGTLANYVLEGSFLVSSESTTRAEVTFYCNTIQGTFTGEGEDELENSYTAELVLNSDGTFTLLVEKGEETIIDKEGTFSVRRFMFVQLILTADDETVYELVISESGLNVNFTLADETELGFMLTKE
jgi:hypothetical protein